MKNIWKLCFPKLICYRFENLSTLSSSSPPYIIKYPKCISKGQSYYQDFPTKQNRHISLNIVVIIYAKYERPFVRNIAPTIWMKWICLVVYRCAQSILVPLGCYWLWSAGAHLETHDCSCIFVLSNGGELILFSIQLILYKFNIFGYRKTKEMSISKALKGRIKW